MTVGCVSLGCAKNQVNSEQMLFLLDQAGYEITTRVENVDVVIVNTCGFIESAKSEAITQILELAELKAEGKIGSILVTGCLAQRYQDELLSELPEVDGIVGCGSYNDIVIAVDQVTEGSKPRLLGDIDAPLEELGRVLTTPEYWAYLRIAEGCDNRCAFCVIPQLRGRYRSRRMEDILDEARDLADEGVKELIVIAQDTSRYGRDLYGSFKLPELLTELCGIEGFRWIRVHYMYPDEITDELLEVFAREDKLVKYFDIPIQHCNDRILKAMHRRGNKAQLEELLDKIRKTVPGAVIRTSLIAGLPGETEDRFRETYDFIKDTVRPAFLHIFPYSRRPGTKACSMKGQVREGIKTERVEILEKLCAELHTKFVESNKGLVSKVLWESDCKDGMMGGYSGNYIRVERPYDSDLIGKITDVVLP